MDRTSKTQPTQRASRFSEILKLKDANEVEVEPEPEVEQQNEESPAPVKSKLVETTAPDEPALPEVEPQAKTKRRGKVSKRGNPDYTQAIFYLRVKTSKQLDRQLLDLADVGIEMDRSELAEELFQHFLKLSEQVGVVEALKQLRGK